MAITVLAAVSKEGDVWTGFDPFGGDSAAIQSYDALFQTQRAIPCTTAPHLLENPLSLLAYRLELAARLLRGRVEPSLRLRWNTLPPPQRLALGAPPRRFLLRVLRGAEDPALGLYAKNSRAEVKADYHVNRGSTADTQFLSFTLKPMWAVYYATREAGPARRIAVVDTEAVLGQWLDVGGADGAAGLASPMAQNFSRDAGEVLLRGAVPPAAIVACVGPGALEHEALGPMGKALAAMAGQTPAPSYKEWRQAVAPGGAEDASVLCSVFFAEAQILVEDATVDVAWRDDVFQTLQ